MCIRDRVYDGHVIKGGTHGFLRHHQFGKPLVDLEAGTLSYMVEPSVIPVEAYPYKVALRLTYTLKAGTFGMRFEFENREEHPVKLSFGWHPGFAVGSLASARLLLPPGLYRREMLSLIHIFGVGDTLLKKSLFTFRDGGLVEVELQYDDPVWDADRCV